MIGAWDSSRFQVFEHAVHVFGWNDLRLFGLAVVSGIGQGLAFVEDTDFAVDIDGNSDDRLAHGVGGTIDLDLIDGMVKLQGQVFRERAGFAPGENVSQVIGLGEGPVGIHRTPGLDGEAAVEIVHEFRQVGIACLPIGDASQTHLFHQTILKGLIDLLHPTFRLRGIGTDDLDVQLLHGSSELR